MAKLLLVAVAAVAVSSWVGVGELPVAAQPLHFELPMRSVVSKEAPTCVAQNTVGADVCEDDPEYDDTIKQRVLALLQQDSSVNTLLKDPSLRNILNDVMVEPKIDPSSVDVRFGGDRESPVCSAQETLIYPKRAKTPNDEWVFVLNQEGVQQALRVEKCTSDGSSCGLGMVLPGDAKATCRQKYVYRRLLVLGSNKIEPEEVLMPSCCVCYTTYQGLLTRSRNATRVHSAGPAPANQPMTPAAASPLAAPAASPMSNAPPFHANPVKFSRSLRRHRIRFPFYH